MKDAMKSTTNLIALYVIILTSIFVLISFFMKLEIDPIILGFWSTIIGFVVGAKAGKNANKHITKEPSNSSKTQSVSDVNKEEVTTTENIKKSKLGVISDDIKEDKKLVEAIKSYE